MIELDGNEIDVLHKLVIHGAQDDGDLPSKSGMVGLIQKGLAIKDYDLVKPNIMTKSGLKYFEDNFK